MTRARDIADLAGGGTLLTRQLFTATAGQTTFTPSAGYNPGALEVFMNGLMLLASDYTATNSSTVVLGVAANAGDEVEILTYQINTIGDTVSASSGGTISSPITVNRNTTDGDILSFNKDGTSVGSIGATSGSSYIVNSTNGGIRLGNEYGRAVLEPCNESGTPEDNLHFIGSSTNRWRDLYLSGGVYLGGTGSANKLDDYEEGTFTPGILNGWGILNPTYSTNAGFYTKVGNIVHVAFRITLSGGSTNANGLKLTGLPFTVGATTNVGTNLSGWFATASNNATNVFLGLEANETQQSFYYQNSNGTANFLGTDAGTGFSMTFSGTYQTA